MWTGKTQALMSPLGSHKNRHLFFPRAVPTGCRQGSLPAPSASKPPNLMIAAGPLCVPATGTDAKPSTQHPPTAISPGGARGMGASAF